MPVTSRLRRGVAVALTAMLVGCAGLATAQASADRPAGTQAVAPAVHPSALVAPHPVRLSPDPRGWAAPPVLAVAAVALAVPAAVVLLRRRRVATSVASGLLAVVRGRAPPGSVRHP